MSSQSHSTSASDAWTTDVLPRLPADLDAQARTLGAFQRQRAFASPSDLLRGLLAYALEDRSLTQLGIWGVLSGVADLAPSSWLERLRNAVPWLRWLAGRLLHAPVRPHWLDQRLRGRLLLIDATTLGFAGSPGDAFRLHLAYDLLAGQLDQLVLTDRRGAEQLRHFSYAPGDLIIADAGYDSPAELAFAHQQGADFLVRVYLPGLPLRQSNGQPLDLLGWIERLDDHSPTLSRRAVLSAGELSVPVRVIAARLPRDQRRAAERRAARKAQRKGRALSTLSLLLAGWQVMVTTLNEQQWSDEELVALYRLRWQVELRIKRLKQLLTGSRLRARSEAGGEALLWAQLVGWALHEPIANELRASHAPQAAEALQTGAMGEEVHSWQLSVLVLETLRAAVRGSWTLARVEACQARLRRYLVGRRRRDRDKQETAAAAWLNGSGPMPGTKRPANALPDFR